MAYVRKTKDVWVVEGNYCGEWDMLTEEETRKEARDMLKCYTENEPQYAHRVRKRRVRIS